MIVREHADQTVVIAGGTAGIGLACAQAFVAAGVRRVVLLGRDPERGSAARASVAAGGAEVLFVPTDAADPDQVVAALHRAHDELGGPDVVVSSVAPDRRPTLLHDQGVAEVRDTLHDMAVPPLLLTRAALPHLTERGGGVVLNIASDAAKVATPGESSIGAAMAAIVMFGRVAAIEAKRVGVRVNTLTPSLVAGTLTTDRVMAGDFSKRLFEKAADQAHLGVAEPEDVAALVVWLASPAAAKVTGQAISVNGGISAA